MHILRMAVLCLCIGAAGAHADAPAKKPHVVFVFGESEYKSEETMPFLAGQLSSKYGMTTTLLQDKVLQDNWKPKNGDRTNDIPGLEALADADLAVFFMRLRTLPENELALIQKYLDSGKPVCGFRTATHSFNYAADDPLAHWNKFGAEVLGAPWIKHYGHESSTDVSVIPEQGDNPILAGVPKTFHVRSWLYQVRPDYPPKSATLLLMGKSVGPGDVPLEKRDENPVAWTYIRANGGRTFMTTMGHPEDFEQDAFRRLVINGFHWALNLPVPAATVSSASGSKSRSDADAGTTAAAFELHDGDRIAFVGNTFVERDVHNGYFETLLTSRFADRKVTFRNLGWSGDTVDYQARPLNFGELTTHLANLKPTIIFACYGMNESFEGDAGLDKFRDGYAKLLDQLVKIAPRIVLVSPIFHQAGALPADADAHNVALKRYCSAIQKLAQERGLFFIDLFTPLASPSQPITSDGIHLNPRGYWMAAQVMAKALGQWSEPRGLTVELNVPPASVGQKAEVPQPPAQAVRVKGAGTDIREFQQQGTHLRVTVVDHDLPLPNAPADGDPEKGGDARMFVVAGLPAGSYEVIEDGAKIASTHADELARGIALAASPETAQAEELRQAIVHKNQLFFYRWRAHNGEYIYGRRAHTGDGNAGNPQFETENAELEKLIAEEEAHIAELAKPRPHVYELREVK